MHKELIVEIPKNKKIFRARCFAKKNGIRLLAKDLGTPPQENTISTRMSPQGIPLFYGALDKRTALNEIIDDKNEKEGNTIIAEFKNLKPLKVLDLSSLPCLPSLFDKKNRDLRDTVRFLRQFSKEVSRFIQKDGREHTEYVPTQVLSEYFRHIFKYKKQNIDGIFYSSSKSDGICCALFVENEECIDPNAETSNSAVLQLAEATNSA